MRNTGTEGSNCSICWPSLMERNLHNSSNEVPGQGPFLSSWDIASESWHWADGVSDKKESNVSPQIPRTWVTWSSAPSPPVCREVKASCLLPNELPSTFPLACTVPVSCLFPTEEIAQYLLDLSGMVMMIMMMINKVLLLLVIIYNFNN